MPKLVRDYGGPFTGFESARARHLCELGSFTADSFDYEADNLEKAFVRRAGSVNKAGIYGVDADVSVNQVGILETGYVSTVLPPEITDIRMRALQMIALSIPSANNAVSVLSAESYGVLFGDLRSDQTRYGQFYWRLKPSNGAAEQNHVVGDEMTNLSTTAGRVQQNSYPDSMKLCPEIAGGRFISKEERAKHAAGSQSCLAISDHVVLPSYDGIPHRWNKTMAATPSSLFIERVFPVGQIPPMGIITVTKGTSNTAGTWQSGDMFWLGVVFERNDGSRSAPTPLRAPNTRFPAVYNTGTRRRTTVGGYGLVLLDDGVTSGGSGTTDYGGVSNTHYDKLSLSGVPVGDYDVKRRYIVRSPKVNGHLEGAQPNIADLRIAAVIENNIDTTCILESGIDADIGADEQLVRYDQIMMPRARHIWHGGGRTFVGNTRINPIAMILAPRILGAAAEASPAAVYIPNDVNVCSSWEVDSADNENGLGLYRYYFTLSATVLTLYKKDSNAAQNPFPNTTFTLSSYATIQDLVDAINAHGTTGVSGATDNSGGAASWMACVAPGADGNTAPTYMNPTLTGGTAASSTQSGTGMYADRISFNSNGTHMYDLQRCYGQCFPGYTLFTTAYLGLYGEQARRVWFTKSGVGQPKGSANNWFDDESYREAPETAGRLMGGAAIYDGSIVCYSNSIYRLWNTKDFNSGEDSDMRLDVVNETRGCICARSIAHGTGWVGYLTREGYVMFSGGRETLISGKIYNPANQQGDWSYEIGVCEAAAGQAEWASGLFYANALGSVLVVGYRTAVAATALLDYPDSVMIYDMSAGATATSEGDAIVDPATGLPWPWSTPLSLRLSACVLAGGENLGCIDLLTVNSATPLTKFFGRVDKFRYGNTDASEGHTLTFCEARNTYARIYSSTTDLGRIGDGATLSFAGITQTRTFANGGCMRHPKVLTVAGCTFNGTTSLTTTTEFGFEHLEVGDLLVQVSGGVLMVVTALVSDEAVTVTGITGSSFSNASLVIPSQVITATAATSTVAATVVSFVGRAITADGYTVTDIPDPSLGSFVRSVTPVYLKLDAGLRVAYTRLRSGPRDSDVGWYESLLPACASTEPFRVKLCKVRHSGRGTGECIELRIRDDGRGARSKIWSVRVEGGTLNTYY